MVYGKKKRGIGFVISVGFFLIFCLGLVALIVVPMMHQGKGLPVLGNPGHVVGHFSLTDQEGRVVTDAEVSGKVRVVEYFFTTCKGICPVMNAHLQRVNEAFAGDTNVVILSHTVDPGNDNPAVMKAYAQSHGAKPGKWYFLTGSKRELYSLAINDYLLSVDSSEADIDHQFIHTPLVALVDREGRIRGFYDATDMKEVERLIAEIKELDTGPGS